MTNGLTLWKGQSYNSKTYAFQDRKANELIRRAGQPLNFYKYIGPISTDPNDPQSYIPSDNGLTNELTIQDIVFGENRDRKYSDEIYDCRGVFQIADTDFDMSQFGITLPEQYRIEMGITDIFNQIGRKPMSGDVIEIVALRDSMSLYVDSAPIKKFVVVTEVKRIASGYGTTLLPHIISLLTKPLVDSPEYSDILHNSNRPESIDDFMANLGVGADGNTGFNNSPGNNNGISSTDPLDPNNMNNKPTTDVFSTGAASLAISLELNQMALEQVRKRSFETRHLYIKNNPLKNKLGLVKYLFNNDGIPEDFDGDVIASGNTFPQKPNENDLFIRNDFLPPELYKREKGLWRKMETAWRDEYIPMPRLLQSFLYNDETTSIGPRADQQLPGRVGLSNAGMPKTMPMPDIYPYKDWEAKGEKFK